jgi:hypothetical protein
MVMYGSSRRILASVAAVCVLIGPGVCGAVCGAGAIAVETPAATESADTTAMPCHAAPEPAPNSPAAPERTLPECCEPDFEQALLSGEAPKTVVRTLVLALAAPVQFAIAPPARIAQTTAPPLLPGAAAHAQSNPPLLI